MDNLKVKLFQLPKTVFTNKDLAVLWNENNANNLKAKIFYYVKQGALIRLRRGVFAKEKDYSARELANSIYHPSYVSFETVLRDHGVVFQHYEAVFVACKLSKTITCGGQKIIFRKLKDEILYNPAGIIFDERFTIASLERAFLDMIYLFPNYYFDNLRPLDWNKCFSLVKIYKNKKLEERLTDYHQKYAE